MKKILHFHPNGNAAASFVAPLMQVESRHGFTTKIITSKKSPRIDTDVINYDLSFKNVIFLPLRLLAIIKIILTYRPDIIISHNSKSSVIPLAAARICSVKNIIYFNHGVPSVGYRGPVRVALLLIEKLNLFLSKEVITVGPSMQRELTRLSSKKPRLIGHGSACGIDLELFNKKKYLNSKFRVKCSLDESDFVVAFIGRPEIRKGFRVVLELFQDPKIVSERKLKLLLCGPSREDVVKLIGSVPENIIALGYCDNIPEVLANCQSLILPSFHEGLPYVCIEAQLMECLVIANKIPGISDVVTADETGLLIEGNDLREYVKTFMRMSCHRDMSKGMLLEARHRAEKYDRIKFMQHYINYLSAYMLSS